MFLGPVSSLPLSLRDKAIVFPEITETTRGHLFQHLGSKDYLGTGLFSLL